ncbi:MAG: carboxymuconolactone decarboxylase family protein [Planctomycetes bacterium]|nr:carboxymuconolactone decarboxylase family protein [Planctomycetota bacterium]
MAFIKTIPIEKASGLLKRIYEASLKRAGRVFQIVRLMSVKPRTLEASMGLYAAVMHAPSSLSRAQREMIATIVSRENNCFY